MQSAKQVQEVNSPSQEDLHGHQALEGLSHQHARGTA